MMKALKKKQKEKQIMLTAAAVTVSCAAFLVLYYALFKTRRAIAEIDKEIDLVLDEEAGPLDDAGYSYEI